MGRSVDWLDLLISKLGLKFLQRHFGECFCKTNSALALLLPVIVTSLLSVSSGSSAATLPAAASIKNEIENEVNPEKYFKIDDEVYFSEGEKAFLTYLLKLYSLDERDILVKKLSLLKKKLQIGSKQEPVLVQVKSFAEFLEKQRSKNNFADYKLHENSDEDLLERMVPYKYVGSSDRVQKKIDDYFKKKNEVQLKILAQLGFSGYEIWQKKKFDHDDFIKQAKGLLLSQLEKVIAPLAKNATAEVVLLTKVLKIYFRELPETQRFEIVYRLLQQPWNLNAMDALLVIVQNSGPQLQKLLQVVGRSEEIPVEFRDLFQKFEKNGQPIPWWKVKQLLQKNGIKPQDFSYFEREPIGVGSMAQTHRVQFRNTDGERQSSVIRFIKPDVEALLEMDRKILIKIAEEVEQDPELKVFRLPSLRSIVEDLHKSATEELDFEKTVQNQTLARKIYKRSDLIYFNNQKNYLSIDVPKTSLTKSSKDVMVQDLALGKSASKTFILYQNLYPELYKVITEKLAEVWVDEAFFKSGFFHADLHQGNFIVLVKDAEIVLSLFDFGMIGQLSPELRESALLLAMGVKFNQAELIATNLLNISKKIRPKGASTAELLKKVEARINNAKTDNSIGVGLKDWTAWALDQGLELNYEFLKLNRGVTLVEELLRSSGSSMSVEKIALKMALENKVSVSKTLFRKTDLKAKDYGRLAKYVLERSDEEKVPSSTSTGSRLLCRSLFR